MCVVGATKRNEFPFTSASRVTKPIVQHYHHHLPKEGNENIVTNNILNGLKK